jgi:ABC-2 type transport system ATP-binding protein
LELLGVTKLYGPVPAIVNVGFAVPTGEIVGLLGPNGAGKSTTMKVIVGILRPNAGVVRLFGRETLTDPIGTKRQVGYVPEVPQLYEFLTGAEYLDFVADMYEMEPRLRRDRIDQFLVALELKGHENGLISGYSLGMKQKVALISALLHRPKFLILDEPLNGLDPRSARLVKDLLRTLVTRDGVAILFSTHVLEIAQTICDRVVILHQGRVLADGTLESLRTQAGLSGSGLEQVFLTLTGSQDLRDVVDALTR